MRPHFENYTLEELYQALETIDRFKYPDRLRELELLIQERAEEYRTGGYVNSGEARLDGRLTISARRLSSKTVFKTVFFGVSIPLVLLTLIAAIAVAAGAPIMKFNSETVTGVNGALITLGSGLGVALVNAIVASLLGCIGVRLHAMVSDTEVE
ncbi:MAG: hypothetical protein AAFN07_17165, partial [Pseudomonadota bacterium]